MTGTAELNIRTRTEVKAVRALEEAEGGGFEVHVAPAGSENDDDTT